MDPPVATRGVFARFVMTRRDLSWSGDIADANPIRQLGALGYQKLQGRQIFKSCYQQASDKHKL